MVGNSYSFFAGSENIGIPRPPNLGGREINLLSILEQFIPPATAGNYCNLKFGKLYRVRVTEDLNKPGLVRPET